MNENQCPHWFKKERKEGKHTTIYRCYLCGKESISHNRKNRKMKENKA